MTLCISVQDCDGKRAFSGKKNTNIKHIKLFILNIFSSMYNWSSDVQRIRHTNRPPRTSSRHLYLMSTSMGKQLVLNNNYGDIHIKDLVPGIHPYERVALVTNHLDVIDLIIEDVVFSNNDETMLDLNIEARTVPIIQSPI